jgi:lambda family phage portal protein
MELNLVDKIVSIFDPAAALGRARARAAMSIIRNYEGASKGRRTTNWFAPGTSAEAAVATSLQTLRNRSRDLVRNNPHANKAVRGIASNTIGTGIVAQFQNSKIKDVWTRWAETTECDADGVDNYYGLQNLVMRCLVESGEVLIRKRKRPATRNLSVPVQLQVLEPDFLDVTKDVAFSSSTNSRIIQGIEFDSEGKRIAYWILPQHPGSRVSFESYANVSFRVPADEIIHLYRRERAGQVRGIPWGSPCIIKLRDFDEYEDAQLVRQKIAACFVGFITDQEAPIDPSSTDKKAISERFEPGMLETLPPGKQIQLASPPGVGSDYAPYASQSLHTIAAGFGVPYEVLTGDYSQVNFSSGRMGWIEFHREIEQWRWNMFIPGFCQNTYNWFLEAAEVAGIVQSNRYKLPGWTAPRREMIDPTKEIAAMKDAVRSGFMSLSESLRQQGYDPAEVLEEYRSDNQKLDELQLTLDSDPRKTNSSGGAANAGTGGGLNGSQND